LRRLIDAAQPLINLLEAPALLVRRHVGQSPQSSLAAKLYLPGSCDCLFQREPPQLAPARRIVGGDVDGERQRAPLKQRISVADRVAVGLVEGEAGEAPLVVLAQ